LNVPHGTHDKQHVRILLCLLSAAHEYTIRVLFQSNWMVISECDGPPMLSHIYLSYSLYINPKRER
jgi:hypothetical protein